MHNKKHYLEKIGIVFQIEDKRGFEKPLDFKTAFVFNLSTYYKYYVEAYKMVNGKKKIITRSALIHGTTLSKKYGVAEKITVDKTKVTLKVGETVKITGTEYNEKKTIRQHRPICFESSNEKVAKVKARKGTVTAVKAGTCKIWVYAQNGLYTCCEVTVIE
ncbi:MAG: Ig-like domain-containing protein [Lachnospiraceae bacterium]|nr:Ig-like domain-containing protein [Lachnospiraceae bacterium]